MTEYLYLLPFADGKHFKIGLSSNDDKRILKINKTYNLLLDQALIVTSSKPRILKVIEEELKIILSPCDHPYGKTEGHTEIRSIEHFEAAIDLIKQKHTSLDLKIAKFNELFIQQPQEVRPKKSSVRVQIDQEEEKRRKQLEFLELINENVGLYREYYFDKDGQLGIMFDGEFPHPNMSSLPYGCDSMKKNNIKNIRSYSFCYYFDGDRSE